MLKINPKRKLWQEVFAYILLTVGSLLFAVGDVLFVNPYLMAPGGTYGLSNVFNTLWPWKISLYAICMDIPLLIIGTWILGPKFGIKTIVSTALIFLFTFMLESWWGYDPVIHDGAITATADPSIHLWCGHRSDFPLGRDQRRLGHHLDDPAQVHQDFAGYACHDC